MSSFEQFCSSLIQENETRYGAEARAKYGDQVIDQSNEMIRSFTAEQYNEWTALEQQILTKLEQAVLDQAAPDGETGKQLTIMHRQWLTHTWGHYSAEAHRGLAQLYICDERFTAYYDRNVSGCATFLRDAICIHA